LLIRVKIGEFRNRLSSYLKKLRQGAEIVISDRDTPIGRIIPFEKSNAKDELKMIDPPKGYPGLASLAFSPKSSPVSPVEELLKERRSR